jgi:ABC-type lipoprotein export system ATPase subunit
MRLREITIRNFKAIEDTTVALGEFNVIVGTNGSGKSSILQALHWVFQSGRNRNIEANKDKKKGATLSEKDATFIPTPEYKNAGYGYEYGNKQGTPQLDLIVRSQDDDGNDFLTEMWIKSARNEGITVHVPSANPLVTKIRDQNREFSAYIPGLAGIPLTEEKRSKLIVQRLAAAGDANTVLRNVLDLLRKEKIKHQDGLEIIEEYVSRIVGNVSIQVEFEDDKNTRIAARFQTENMKREDPRRFKPLELAGIGFLQVIQIFAYLVYFRPVILLVDEPDAHLHPTAQERLVTVLSEAATRFGTQVIMTTHSPSVIRALPAAAQVIWMKDGKVQPNGDTDARSLMGWGLLDRRVLLMTEDSEVGPLRALLSQWPDLDRVTAIWPFHGSAKLPTAETIKGLHDLFGDSLKIVIHRDRDFLMPIEAETISKAYEEYGFKFWFTERSDIEAYWAEINLISAHYNIDDATAELILEAAIAQACANDAALIQRRKKRNEIYAKITDAKKGSIPQFGDIEVETEAQKYGQQHSVLGKDLVAAIRKCAQDRKIASNSVFAKSVPRGYGGFIAEDLKLILEQAAM